jgi:fructoselysine-6-P-deglycase FrlB-like protein
MEGAAPSVPLIIMGRDPAFVEAYGAGAKHLHELRWVTSTAVSEGTLAHRATRLAVGDKGKRILGT